MRSRLAFVLCAACAATAATAGAQPKDPAAAEELFRAGRTAAQAGEYAAACPRFAESYRLDPAAGTLLNLADCEEHLGRVASAWQHFREAAERLPNGDDRIAFARRRAAALEPRLPRLTVKLSPGAPAGTTVRRDQVDLGAASLGIALPTDPGAHTVVAVAPGRQPASYPVSLREGQSAEIAVAPGPAQAAGPADVAARAPDVPARPGGSRRTIGWIAAGVGVAGVAVGSVTGLMVLGRKRAVEDHCDAGRACDAEGLDAASSGKTLSTASTISFAVGLAGAGAGVVLLLGGGGPGGGGTAVVTAPTAGGATLTVGRSFR